MFTWVIQSARECALGNQRRAVRSIIEGDRVSRLPKPTRGMRIGSATNGTIVGPQPVHGVATHVTGEEGTLKGIQLARHAVLTVELVLGEHPQKDVLCQRPCRSGYWSAPATTCLSCSALAPGCLPEGSSHS